jgi:hypothetical protein
MTETRAGNGRLSGTLPPLGVCDASEASVSNHACVAASLDACLKRKQPMLNLKGFETPMTDIPVKYIVDENDQKVAVQMDIETFRKIEEALENYGLSELIRQSLDEESLSLKEAKSFYDSLEKPE